LHAGAVAGEADRTDPAASIACGLYLAAASAKIDPAAGKTTRNGTVREGRK
jgi:hypothetical protein